MEDKLRLNTKLYGFDGVIGRRDFILNSMYISAIAILVTTPYSFWLSSNSTSYSDLLNPSALFLSAPILLKIWLLGLSLVAITLSVSNIVRRLNDINGGVNKIINSIVAGIAALSITTYFLPYLFICILGFVNFIISLFLYIARGKITSKYPYDFRKVFNWGAFFGTWIWGLINRTYVTLWQLVLFFTPWGIIFAIICGLKGNEWAFKNKKCNDVEKFNKSQRKQATVFSILTLVLIPILYLAFIIILVASVMMLGSNGNCSTPCSVNSSDNNEVKVESTLDKFMNGMVDMYFEEYSIEENENKFYVLSEEWKLATFEEKKDMMEMAATLSANERRKMRKADDEYVSYSKALELPRTKIYSVETGQLLGEYLLDKNINNNSSFTEIVKAALKAYRFYQPE